jgi:hypothetical protein
MFLDWTRSTARIVFYNWKQWTSTQFDNTHEKNFFNGRTKLMQPASEGRTLVGKKYRENKKDWNNNFAGRIAKDFGHMQII